MSDPRPDLSPVSVYPTGVLRHLLVIARVLNPGWLRARPWPAWLPRHPSADVLGHLAGPRWRSHGLRSAARGIWRDGRQRRGWRGYYAEGPPGVGRVGTGWTRRRALADLARAADAAAARHA